MGSHFARDHSAYESRRLLVPVNRYVVEKSGHRQLVLYWFQAHGRAVASEYSAKYYLIHDSIQLHRSDGSLVRLMTPCSKASPPMQPRPA